MMENAACHYSEKIQIYRLERTKKPPYGKQFRKTNGEYDCIVSGSGGKDSVSLRIC